MNDHTGKLLYDANHNSFLHIVGHVNALTYAAYSVSRSDHYKAIDVDKLTINILVAEGTLRAVEPGDKLTYEPSYAFTISRVDDTRLIFKEGGFLTCKEFILFECKFENTKAITTNKNRTTCFNCRCPTELRRDFSTFEVREMCPRCKF